MTDEQRQATIDAIKDLINSKLGKSSKQGSGGGSSNLNSPGKPNNQKSNQNISGGSSNKDKSNSQNGKSGSGSSSKGNNKSVQIGDRGSAEIQAAEEAERKATIEKEKAEDAANKAKEAGDDDLADQNNDLAKEAQDVQDEANDLADDIDENGLGKKEAERLKKIKDRLEDIENQRKAIDETERAVFNSRQLAGDRKRRLEYERDPSADFLKSVQLFIKDQVSDQRFSSWNRPDKRFSGTNIIHKGKATKHDVPVPLLAIYFDRSGSWDDSKIKVGQRAIASLDKYVKRGELKIKVYYFADDVASDPTDRKLGGATSATQKILDHIESIKANNVIIMTDSDMDGQGEFTRKVTVPGAVWFLFKGGRCYRIMEYLHGKKLNKVYDL